MSIMKTVIFLATFFCLAFCSEKVPLFLWTNARDVSCPQKPQGPDETVSHVFSLDYLNCLANGNPDQIIIFMYEKLGIEDLSVFGQQRSGTIDPFSNVKKYTKELPSLTIPSMHSTNMVEDLMRQFKTVFDGTNIKVINLPPIDRSTDSSTASGLRKLDENVRDKINKLNGKYIAVLTSEGTPSVSQNFFPLKNKRHLLSVPSTNITKVALIGKCVYLTFESLNLTVTPRQPSNAKPITSEVNPTTDKFTLDDCSNGTTTRNTSVSITLEATENKDFFGEVVIEMTFNKKFYKVSAREWWTLSAVVVSYNNTKTALNPRTFKEITAPAEFSFVCSQTEGLFYYDYKTGSHDTVSIRFHNLQVQPFGSNNTYGDAADCVGWYTGPIWSGLIVSVLLILIFFFGLGMSANVTTMDRFDNPKGKSIIVPQDN